MDLTNSHQKQWSWPWWMKILWGYSLLIIVVAAYQTLFPAPPQPVDRRQTTQETSTDYLTLIGIIPILLFLIITGAQNFYKLPPQK